MAPGAQVICFYHQDCLDGMGAAWAVWKALPLAEFIGLKYDEPIDVNYLVGKKVIVVDYSFDEETTNQIIGVASEFTMLDHHARSEKLAIEVMSKSAAGAYPNCSVWVKHDPHMSGATMAWEHFHGTNRLVPAILKYIEDHDLWEFNLPSTRAIVQGLQEYPINLKVWARLFEEHDFLERLEKTGIPFVRKLDANIEQVIRLTKRKVGFVGHYVPMVNCPRFMMSETVDVLSEGEPFAVGYYDTGTERYFSLRSKRGTGMNVRVIAEENGGGGHDHAASFRVPRSHELAKI